MDNDNHQNIPYTFRNYARWKRYARQFTKNFHQTGFSLLCKNTWKNHLLHHSSITWKVISILHTSLNQLYVTIGMYLYYLGSKRVNTERSILVIRGISTICSNCWFLYWIRNIIHFYIHLFIHSYIYYKTAFIC